MVSTPVSDDRAANTLVSLTKAGWAAPAVVVPGSHSPWQHQAGKKTQADFLLVLILPPTISAHGQLSGCAVT